VLAGLSCLLLTSCYSPSPQLEAAAGVAPRHLVLRAGATGVFITPNLVLTNRHLFKKDFLGFACEHVRAASADGQLRGAELALVGFPADAGVDLALLRLKRGSYPSVAPVLHLFDLAAKTDKANARVIGYPYRDLWDDQVAMTLVSEDLVALGSTRATVNAAGEERKTPGEFLKIGDDGGVTRFDTGDPPTGPTFLGLLVDPGLLRPGASGSPIVDTSGRLIGITAATSEDPLGENLPKLGLAVDASDVDRFLTANGLRLAIDPGPDDGVAKVPDIRGDVVRLFCF
jgi:hypothetical protein